MSCSGTLNLDIRNFLSSSDNFDVSQLAALGDNELHKLAEVEVISDSDIPFTLDRVLTRFMVRTSPDEGSLSSRGRFWNLSPAIKQGLRETPVSWSVAPEHFEGENQYWTLIDRCQVGDINWCRPSSDGNWFWSNMFDSSLMGFNIDGQNHVVEREIKFDIDHPHFGDLNSVFAQVIAEAKVGCPNKGYTCGPFRQHRYCNGHQGRTHCHIETGNCVDPEWAAQEGLDVFNEFRHD